MRSARPLTLTTLSASPEKLATSPAFIAVFACIARDSLPINAAAIIEKTPV